MAILVDAKRLDKIPYSDKPLPQGGEIVYLSPAEFEQKFGFTYTEALLGEPAEVISYLRNKELLNAIRNAPDLPTEEAVLERLANPLDCLVVCKMDDPTGHGLYASRDILAGTVLFMYSGAVEDIKSHEVDGEYTYVWGSVKANEVDKAVNAKKYGGLARFMQHLPQDKECHRDYLRQVFRKKFGSRLEEKGINLDVYVDVIMQNAAGHELENIKFHNYKIKEQLATENVRLCQTVINGKIVIVCVAKYDIKKGEQVGFPYGEPYWQAMGKSPRYFQKDGQLISTSEYTYRDQLEKKSVATLVKTNNDNDPQVLYKRAVENFDKNNFELAITQLNQVLVVCKEHDLKLAATKKLAEIRELRNSSKQVIAHTH